MKALIRVNGKVIGEVKPVTLKHAPCKHCGHLLEEHFTTPYLGQIDPRPDCKFGKVRAVICKYEPITK